MSITDLNLYQQAILLLAGLITLTSFLMLGQSRLPRLVGVFALQGCLLAISTAIAASVLNYPHLYISAALSLLLKGIIIPIMLQRLILKLGLHRVMDTIDHPTRVMMGGAGLVVFSYYVSLPVVSHSTLVTLNAIGVIIAKVFGIK